MDHELRLARLESEFDAFCDRRDTERKEADKRIDSLERTVEQDPAGAARNLTKALQRVIDVEVLVQTLLSELEPIAPGLTERVSKRLLEESERLADGRRDGEGVRESALRADTLADQTDAWLVLRPGLARRVTDSVLTVIRPSFNLAHLDCAVSCEQKAMR